MQREAQRQAAQAKAAQKYALYQKFLEQNEARRTMETGVRVALVQAAEGLNSQMVRQLLKKGYDPNYSEDDFNDYTALRAVVGQEYYWENPAERKKGLRDISTIIRLLVQNGAKVQDENGTSSLFYTALEGGGEGPPLPPIIRELLRAGVDPNQKFGDAKDPYNNGTPLGIIGRFYDYREDERAIIIDDLLRFGARLEGRDWWGRTALLQVLDKWNAQGDEAMLLLKRGAKVNVRDRNRRTPLHALFGATPENGITTVDVDLPFVKTMLRHGANPNARNTKGRTPLHFAVENLRMSANNWEYFQEYFSAVRLLIKFGADVNARDENGQTPLFYLLQGFDNDAPVNARVTTAKLLFTQGADPNVHDIKGQTPLLILSKQASQGKTPAFFAAMRKTAQLLLQNGANVTVSTPNGTSALELIPPEQRALRHLLKQWGAR